MKSNGGALSRDRMGDSILRKFRQTHVWKCFLESHDLHASRQHEHYKNARPELIFSPLHAAIFWSMSSNQNRPISTNRGGKGRCRRLPYLRFGITPVNNGWKVKGLSVLKIATLSQRGRVIAGDESLSRRSLLSSIGPLPYTVIIYTISTAR